MSILVTGGAGFIGSNLIRTLIENNNVIAVDNFITGDKKNLTRLLPHPSFIFIEADITNVDFTRDPRFSSVNQIYHLACPTGVPNCKTLGIEMLATSIIGTKNVLDLAKKNKASILFTSSSEVYGDPKIFPQKETYWGNVDPVGFRSPYEEGKRAAESLIVNYRKKYQINAKIVRIFNTYGKGMTTSDQRVIPRFVNQAINNKPLTVEGSGQQQRTFCYIDDTIEELLTVMEKGESGQIYNIGSDIETTIIDLAFLIVKLTKSNSKIMHVKRPEHDPIRRMPDLSKIKKMGWQLKTNLDHGLLQTIAYFSKAADQQTKS